MRQVTQNVPNVYHIPDLSAIRRRSQCIRISDSSREYGVNKHQGLCATRCFHQPFLSTTTRSHIPCTVFLCTPKSLQGKQLTPPRHSPTPPSSPSRHNPPSPKNKGVINRRVLANEQHNRSTRRSFSTLSTGKQEEDGTYFSKSHTLMSDGWRSNPPPPPKPTSTTNIWPTAKRHDIISRSFCTTSKQLQQHTIRSSVRHELVTKTSSPSPPVPPRPL